MRGKTRLTREPASFRDPDGFLFRHDGTLYRQVNLQYQPHYDSLMGSGLYEELVAEGLLIRHQEVEGIAISTAGYKVLKPEPISFVSYPYEWTFGHLKTAALLTLKVQKAALDTGMTLKDASAFNVQFRNGRPVLIDSLSFAVREPGEPWVAYRQFCKHFLGPLALLAYRDVSLIGLFRQHIDGIPLSLTSKLLPARTRLVISLLVHIHLHAAAERRYSDRKVERTSLRSVSVNESAAQGLVESLEKAVWRLKWEPRESAWIDYYDFHNYGEAGLDEKLDIVRSFIREAQPKTCWDLGSNVGRFSALASEHGAMTVGFDLDYGAVEAALRMVREESIEPFLPLVMDLSNPSPALGWGHEERLSLRARGPVDMVLALALVHHLAISGNVPLPRQAAFLADLGRWLAIEFVPKSDSQVKRLLQNRADVFDDYTASNFEWAFRPYFETVHAQPIPGSARTLYLMKRRDDG